MTKQLTCIIICTFCLGCKILSQQKTTTQPLATTPDVDVATTKDESPFLSFRRAFRWTGFRSTPDEAPNLVPPEIARLNNVIHTIVARTSELNMNDPPETTRQKAQSILDATQPWESLLSAGQSIGFLNDQTIQHLNQFVFPIRTEAHKLVQYGANPQTIAVLQQLNGGLKATFDSTFTMYARGKSAYQYLAGSDGPRNPS